MKLDIAARTHLGLIRRRNEDACGLWPPAEGMASVQEGAVFCVADGMGGHPGGEVASALATGVVVRGGLAESDPRDHLKGLYREAAAAIRARGREEPRLADMGTTLTIALFRPGQVWVGSIGDTRLYWVRGDRLLQVTRDHTMAEDLIQRGLLEAEAAEAHPSSNVLTRCLGVCPDQDPDVLEAPLHPEEGDCFLLASDGLAKAVPTRELPSILGRPRAEDAAATLVQAALDGGGPDNVTVIAIRVVDPGPGGNGAVPFGRPDAIRWSQGF